MKTAREILEKHTGEIKFIPAAESIFVQPILDAMEEYAVEYYNHNKIKLKGSDCTCCGDQNGFMTNPDCILHGKNRMK